MSYYNQSSDFEGTPSELFQKKLKNIYKTFSEYGDSLKEKNMSLQIEICGSFSWIWAVTEKKMSMSSILRPTVREAVASPQLKLENS